MEKTQGTLNKNLARLSANIPFLVKEFPNKRQLWAELAGLIDDIQVCAKPADRVWVSERINALLLMNGISSRAENGDILEGPAAMPEPSNAMRVDVASPNRSLWEAIQSIDTRYVAKALNTIMSEHLQYELKAWIEGCYARRCGRRSDKCPYEHDTAMALAWLRGWRYQEDPSSELEGAHRPGASPNLSGTKRLAI
jgi:ribosome modulation factor